MAFLQRFSHVHQQFIPASLDDSFCMSWLVGGGILVDLWLANLPPLTYSPLENKVLIRETNGFFVLIMEKKQTTKKTGGGSKSMCCWCFFQLKCVCLLMFKVLSSVSSSPKVPSLSPTLSDLAHHITIHRVTKTKVTTLH